MTPSLDDHRVVNIHGGFMGSETQPEVVILTRWQRLIENAICRKERSAQQNTRWRYTA